MAPFRTTRAQLRPWVAMVAAYAVVLQMLFGIAVASVTAAAAGSSGDPFVICYGNRGVPVDNPIPADYPRHKQHCILCSVAAPAAVLPAAAGSIVDGFVRWPAASGFQPAQHRTPRLSQGPPQTA
jgi:hypothetical protein